MGVWDNLKFINPLQYPGRDVMNKIYSTFAIQPGELLEWVPDV